MIRGGSYANNETEYLKMKFMFLLHNNVVVFALQVYYHSDGFKTCLETFCS